MAAKKKTGSVKATDMLQSLTKKVTPVRRQKSESNRPVIHVSPQELPSIVDLVELNQIIAVLEPILDDRKNVVKDFLFAKLTATWFANKQVPENPRIVVERNNGDEDSNFLFVVKYREQGLTKIVPPAEELSEGITPEVFLTNLLTKKPVCLTKQNATELVLNEIQISPNLQLTKSIDKLLESDDPLQVSAANKLLSYLTSNKSDSQNLQFLTDDEKNVCLQTSQTVHLKKGFFERVCGYVNSAEQLKLLLAFVQTTLQLSSFSFGISQTPAEKTSRLTECTRNLLYKEQDK